MPVSREAAKLVGAQQEELDFMVAVATAMDERSLCGA